ncbi:hypothetical protein OG711_19430 [Streptomyces uncialis]|uniref:hypothetical protein n=1 Tax=Streptomyces uncialis TaxID=1048205 RepID=UPI002E33A44C|nr:hypothetical protein [Streptomyces uncialis]
MRDHIPPDPYVFAWPPCRCPWPDCPDQEGPDLQREREEAARTARSRLEARIRLENDRRRRLGTYWRLL